MSVHATGTVKQTLFDKRLLSIFLIGLAIYAGFVGISMSYDGNSWGVFSVFPTLLVLIVAIFSKRPFESMITGCVAAMVMMNPFNLVKPFADNLYIVLGDETIIWIVVVCGLMGGLIQLLEISGCLNGFSQFLRKIIKNRRQSMLATFVMGLLMFADDYLNCLAVSTSVKKLTDYYQISREKLAYLVDSTAAPSCVIVPISTWAVFFSGLLEDNGVAAKGDGMDLYISAIPYMAYAWIALVIVFLVAVGILGDIGPMKKAEERAKAGQPIPPEFKDKELQAKDETNRELPYAQNMMNFIVPMVLLVISTIYFDIDLLQGCLLTCAVTIVFYWLQGILSFEKQVDSIFTGFKVMLYPLSTVVGGFFLKTVNEQLGMTNYVIDTISPWVSASTFPAVIFTVMAFLTFATASSWGLYIIAMPIVFPVAESLGVSMPLVVGALLSASSFGSHACFFSDSSLLAAQGAGCTPMQHAFTQFPYAFLGGILSIFSFLALGVMM